MLLNILKSKIHGVYVTAANLDYEGSISISPYYLELAGIHVNEQVHIWNVTNGNRIQTYAIEGLNQKYKNGNHLYRDYDFQINGAAAHLFSPGDKIIIATFAMMTEKELKKHKPKVIIP